MSPAPSSDVFSDCVGLRKLVTLDHSDLTSNTGIIMSVHCFLCIQAFSKYEPDTYYVSCDMETWMRIEDP